MNTENTMDTKATIDLNGRQLVYPLTPQDLRGANDLGISQMMNKVIAERDALRTALTAIVTIDDRYSGLDSIARDLMSITARAALGGVK